MHEKDPDFTGSLPWVRIVFTFVVPIAFITTVPADAFLGHAAPSGALGSAVVAVGLLAASRLFWCFAVRNSSASS